MTLRIDCLEHEFIKEGFFCESLLQEVSYIYGWGLIFSHLEHI